MANWATERFSSCYQILSLYLSDITDAYLLMVFRRQLNKLGFSIFFVRLLQSVQTYLFVNLICCSCYSTPVRTLKFKSATYVYVGLDEAKARSSHHCTEIVKTRKIFSL